jgi:hypothetical protein
MRLRRYWFEFSVDADLPPGVKRGCGVTAYDLSDALRIVRDRVFGGAEPPIVKSTEDIDVSTLDPGHVLPNMMPPSNRGVWFPLGYSG